MGGSSKGQTAPANSNAVAASQPAYLANTAPVTMPAFMPGQRLELAQQLAGGFAPPSQLGPAMTDWGKMLDQIYAPSQSMNFNVAKPVAKPAAKPAAKAPVSSPLNMAKPTAKVPSLGRNAR